MKERAKRKEKNGVSLKPHTIKRQPTSSWDTLSNPREDNNKQTNSPSGKGQKLLLPKRRRMKPNFLSDRETKNQTTFFR